MFFTLQGNAKRKTTAKRYVLTRNEKVREYMYFQKMHYN